MTSDEQTSGAGHRNTTSYEDQPGLEVDTRAEDYKIVIPRGEGLEVDARPADHKFVVPGEEGLEAAHDNTEKLLSLEESTGTDPVRSKKPWWKRRWPIVIITVVVIIVIVGAVVGGVLGHQASTKSGDVQESEDGTTSPDNGNNTITSPGTSPGRNASSLAPGSPLSATALSYRQAGIINEYYISLAYRDISGKLKVISQGSTYGSTDVSWGKPRTIAPGYQVSNESGIAISIQLNATTDRGSQDVNFTITYLDESNSIRSMYFGYSNKENTGFREGLIDSSTYLATENTPIAAYSSFAFFMTDIRKLQLRVVSLVPYQAAFEDSNALGDASEPSKERSSVALVPLQTNITNPQTPFYVAGFYQQEKGKLAGILHQVLLDDEKEDKAKNAALLKSLWPKDLPNITFPTTNHFSAFATARVQYSSFVNIYILYQDEDNDIQVTWTTGGGKWQSASPDALKGADASTDIACITMSATGIAFAYPTVMEPDTDLARCYFQRKGALVEVQLQNNTWIEKGIVPLE